MEGSCTNAGMGCGWDEEITKQTGGFYERKQNLLTGAKLKQKLQRGGQKREGGRGGGEEKKQNVGLV